MGGGDVNTPLHKAQEATLDLNTSNKQRAEYGHVRYMSGQAASDTFCLFCPLGRWPATGLYGEGIDSKGPRRDQ